MLMKNCSRGYISKTILVTAVLSVLILLFFGATLAAKFFLMAHKPEMENQLGAYLGRKVAIGSVHYVPPSFIIVRDISVFGNDDNAQSCPLKVDRVTLVFSLKELFAKEGLVINKLYFIRPVVDYEQYPFFLKEHIDGIIAILNLLTRGKPLSIVIEDSSYILARNAKNICAVNLDSKISIGAKKDILTYGKISLRGCFGQNSSSGEAEPDPEFNYRFSGAAVEGGLKINDFEISQKDLKINFKGELARDTLALQGAIALENFYGAAVSEQEKKKKMLDDLKKLIMYRKIPKPVGISAGGLNIYDINCLIRFEDKKVIAERIEFYFNKIPVLVQGSVSLLDKLLLEAKVATFPDQPAQERVRNRKRFDAKILTDIKDGRVNGKIDLGFARFSGNQDVGQRVEFVFNDASFGISPDARVKLFVQDMSCAYAMGKELYIFPLQEVNGWINLLDKNMKLIEFDSRVFDGQMQAQIQTDLGFMPPKVDANLKFKKVSAHELDSLLLSLFGAYRNLPAKLQGRVFGLFSCDINYVAHYDTQIHGNVEIENGYLDNVKFFVWLADFFNIPLLTRVDFSRIFAEFRVNEKVAVLDQISLDGEEVDIAGTYSLKENELLNSTLSISLSRNLLSTSSKFQLLLSLIGTDLDQIDFDFQLSGLYAKPNFKWLRSDFKQRLQKKLPGFIERGLENKVERAVQSISQN